MVICTSLVLSVSFCSSLTILDRKQVTIGKVEQIVNLIISTEVLKRCLIPQLIEILAFK